MPKVTALVGPSVNGFWSLELGNQRQLDMILSTLLIVCFWLKKLEGLNGLSMG